MPRCFMAKKLKSNLYQQWKQEQENNNQRSASPPGSRSPSPITMMDVSTHEDDHLERSKELASTVASSGVAHTGHDLSHNGGKWCYFVHLVFNSQNGCKPRVIRIQQYTKKICMGFCVFNVCMRHVLYFIPLYYIDFFGGDGGNISGLLKSMNDTGGKQLQRPLSHTKDSQQTQQHCLQPF